VGQRLHQLPRPLDLGALLRTGEQRRPDVSPPPERELERRFDLTDGWHVEEAEIGWDAMDAVAGAAIGSP